ERYPLEDLLKDQSKNPVSFAAQMLNNPVAGVDLAFQAAWLRIATLELDDFGEPWLVIPDEYYIRHASVLHDETPPQRVRLADCSKVLLVDPAPSTETERRQQPLARTALVLKCRDPWGRRFKLDVWAGREEPIAEVQRMFKMMRRWQCDRIAVEEVNFSKLYKPLIELIGERDFDGWKPRYVPLKPGGRDKDTRISGKRGD